MSECVIFPNFTYFKIVVPMTNSQPSTTEPGKNKNKNKLSKQLEQKQNHRNGDHMESYPWERGEWRMGEKVQGKRSITGRYKINSLTGVAQWIELRLRTKRSPVRFPVRAHAWAVGQVPSGGPCERQSHIDVSLPLFLPPFLSLNE